MTPDPDDVVPPPMTSTSWNTQDVGYFVPNNAVQQHHYSHHGATYFTNVHAFVNHLKALESHMSITTIRDNIHFCLRGNALDWHAVELSSRERSDLGILPLQEGWYKSLTERFQPLYQGAEAAYWDASYTLEDAKARRDPVKWAHNILRHAQAMEYKDIRSQLDHIVHVIDEKLAWGVACPDPTRGNMVSDVMRDLDFYYSIWCYEQDQPDSEPSSGATTSDSQEAQKWASRGLHQC